MSTRHKFGAPVALEGLHGAVMPYHVFGFHEDFHNIKIASEDISYGGWTATGVANGVGTDSIIAVLSEIGGGLKMLGKGTMVDHDGVNLVKDGGMFEADTDTDIIFEVKMRIDGAITAPNWLVGLCKPGETAFLANDNTMADVRNACFISQADTFGLFDVNSTRVAGVTDTRDTSVGTIVDDTFMTFRIVISGRSKIEFFVDGVLVSSSIVNDAIPDGTLTPIIAWKVTKDEIPEYEIKYVDCWQTYKQAT